MEKLNPEFVASLGALPGLEGLAEALESTPAEVSVRWRRGVQPAAWPETDGVVAWWPSGRYLKERRDFTRDPLMHQGLYYVQEAASMFAGYVAAELTRSAGPLRVLDACAAPGGKTTVMVEALPAGSVVVANELSAQRAAVLVENVAKHGSDQVIVTRGDAARYGRMEGEFDLVLCDAPCSGEGMMRKDAVARTQWSPRLVAECAATQRTLVTELWRSVRPGGHMIYSTCTFNRHEDEEIVGYLVSELGAEPVAVPTDPAWGITPGIGGQKGCCRFVPGRTRGEGLFMAVLRRPDSQEVRPLRVKRPLRPSADQAELLTTLDEPTAYCTVRLKNAPATVYAVTPAQLELMGRVEAAGVDIIWAGTAVAEEAGRAFAPAHALALSRHLRADAYPRAEVDLSTALSYLRRNAVTLADTAPRGYVLLTYGGAPLGFVKNLGNRANNLYPPAWRIRSTP